MAPHVDGSTSESLPRAFINKRGEPIVIHLLDAKTADRLVDMYLAYQPRNSFQGLPPIKDEACVKWVRQMIANGTNLAALCFEKGVVGHAALFPMDETRCEMFVVVSPSLQNAGIGTELTRSSIQVCYEMGFQGLWLDVESTNVRARHVYKKCGFEYVRDKGGRELEMSLDLKRYRDAARVSAAEIMNRQTASLNADAPCRAAVELLLARGVDALPVIESNGELLGVISETELLTPSNLDKTVRDVLTWQVPTASADCKLERLARMFQSHRVRCIPIVDEGKKLLGVVGRKDVLAYYARHLPPPADGSSSRLDQ
jgi:CBS domain-containing protein